MPQIIFMACLFFCLMPWASPPLALALGLVMAFTVGHPFKQFNGQVIKYLLQVSVIGLGFGLNFGEVVNAGKTGVLFTVVSILGTLIVGYLIGKWMSINKKTSYLISTGTAICGGSAIAAIAPIIDADENEVAIALKNKSTKIQFPYFILGFIWVSLIVTFLPDFRSHDRISVTTIDI